MFLVEYPVPLITVDNCLKSIGSTTITYDNYCPLIKWAMIYQIQLNYVEYIIVTRDTLDVVMSIEEVIQVISYIVHLVLP